MPIIGTNVGQSVAGVQAAERQVARATEKKDGGKAQVRRRSEDEIIVGAEAAESPDQLRSLKSNDQEESHKDHEERPGYTPTGTLAPKDKKPRLDVAG